MKCSTYFALAAALFTFPAVAANAASADRLSYGITGGAADGPNNPSNLLGNAPIQDLVLKAAQGPVSQDSVDLALRGSDAKADNLVASGIFRRTADGRFLLAMNLLTADDIRLLNRIAGEEGADLATAFLRQRGEFDRILSKYDLSGIDRAALAYILIGCVVLDWDGLSVTAAEKYRNEAPDRGDLGQYFIFGRERADDLSVRSLYWGSHSDQFGGIWLTSFGDHHSLPRKAFPDLVWNFGPDRIQADWPRPLRSSVARVAKTALEEREADAALILLQLRGGGLDEQGLARAAGIDADRASTAIRLLESLGYIRRNGNRVESLVPIFTARDSRMIGEIRALGQKILSNWLRSNYSKSKRELSGLTALKQGVPFGNLYSEVWHYTFGWANYHLVQAGMFVDPYGPKHQFIGFIPFAWEGSLKLND